MINRALCVLALLGVPCFVSVASEAPAEKIRAPQIVADAARAASHEATGTANSAEAAESSMAGNAADHATAIGVVEGDGGSSGDGAPAWTCPGTGNCCVANGTPGCDDYDCCFLICDLFDYYCCEYLWDDLCAGYAIAECDPDACGGGCPGEGDCCVPNWSPGCEDEDCCNLVCAEDSWCCDVEWDSQCVDWADDLCPELCGPPPVCPGEGDCCLDNGTPGCENGCCCQVVCAVDRDCCDTAWDAACVTIAEDVCPSLCSPPYPGCPGEGDCSQPNQSPGCDDEFCCSLVCAQDDYCCTTAWDSMCVDLAADVCDCPEPLCPGEGGPCCQANMTTGCDDPFCCDVVCDYDGWCCDPDIGWDAICVSHAEYLCGNLCSCVSFGDFEDDGDVDLADFARFQNCFTGILSGPVVDGCPCAHFDEGGTVGLTDYQAFHTVMGD